MGLALKGMEIENFKSYTQRQFIRFSGLSVLLGANVNNLQMTKYYMHYD